MGINHNGTVYLFRKNVFGDVTHIYDTEGNLKARYIYDAWGNHKIVDTNENDNIGEINPIRYRSYYYDDEIGLYYLRARYYDPETGRFISQDNISYLDPEHLMGLNLYAYCNNDPIQNLDPTGCAILTTLLIATIAGAIVGGAMGGISYAISTPTGGFDGRELAANVVGGTVSGAVTTLFSCALTPILGPTFSSAISGAIGSMAGSVTKDGIMEKSIGSGTYWRKEIFPKAIGSGITGAITGGFLGQVGTSTTWLDELTQGTLVEFTTWFTSYTIEGASNYIKSLK